MIEMKPASTFWKAQSYHQQYLSRGGSDASCAASKGLTARPVTLGLPVENSHGYEIMHRDAPGEMLRLLLAYLAMIGAQAGEPATAVNCERSVPA